MQSSGRDAIISSTLEGLVVFDSRRLGIWKLWKGSGKWEAVGCGFYPGKRAHETMFGSAEDCMAGFLIAGTFC